MSSTSSNPYFFFYFSDSSDVFRSSSPIFLCHLPLQKKGERKEKKGQKKYTQSIGRCLWIVSQRPLIFWLAPSLPSSSFSIAQLCDTRKETITFGKWKSVKAITFGAYLAKIECDTARPLESVSMVDSINSASSSSSTYPAHFSKLVISEFLLPFPSLKLYSSVLNHLDDYDQNWRDNRR